jgi:hypothetical protein
VYDHERQYIGKKPAALSALNPETIILPRQAQDKYFENSKTTAVCEGIWVDGVRVALESRFLDVEDGPTSLRRVCHPTQQRAAAADGGGGGGGAAQRLDRHPSDYRGGVAEVWVGEPSPVAIGRSGTAKNDLLSERTSCGSFITSVPSLS